MNSMLWRIWCLFGGGSKLPVGFRPPGPISDLQLELTQMALTIADRFGARLDFSDESIQHVERILAELHNEYQKTKDEYGLKGVAIEFGAYIASTIQLRTGEGRLERDHPDFGEATFPFYFRKSTLFPYAWCMKRIVDGESDDIWMKYRALVLNGKV
jgi:hypothetical protein